MKRKCPNCKEKTISILKLVLLVWNTRCTNCGNLVGTHGVLNLLFFFVAFIICLFSTILFLNKFGFGLDIRLSIVLIWVFAEVLREIIVPLEIKDSRIT